MFLSILYWTLIKCGNLVAFLVCVACSIQLLGRMWLEREKNTTLKRLYVSRRFSYFYFLRVLLFFYPSSFFRCGSLLLIYVSQMNTTTTTTNRKERKMWTINQILCLVGFMLLAMWAPNARTERTSEIYFIIMISYLHWAKQNDRIQWNRMSAKERERNKKETTNDSRYSTMYNLQFVHNRPSVDSALSHLPCFLFACGSQNEHTHFVFPLAFFLFSVHRMCMHTFWFAALHLTFSMNFSLLFSQF